ncbi:MAG: two-component regulator propeller domain-containing protein [Candidatus Pedobacter colombiensis]|uniref:histidine kinase n=1 Tax=Candidatus Pedobacter colombiensis TaxID=3121371 RepID=A0AAJ6BA94_9SPHI|nr:two-component regulator propeller domain-containing protein [Pedobacter sp.]WEK21033.1 MAG: two-component regulator propeller domain-containing protein [Pedobacter sp.]
MISFRKSAILILFCFAFKAACAQNLKFRHIGIENGLSNSTIECILQDYRGFIWFGTRDGLNKYDGNQITVYQNSKESSSISDNYIRCIYEDQAHTLWIGTSSGLNRFNPEKNNFTRYQSDPKDSHSLSNNTVLSIKESPKGLWIGTSGGGLNLLNPTTNQFSRYHPATTSLGGNNVNDVQPDEKGNLWLATDHGLSYFNTKKGTFKSISGLEKFMIRVITASPTGDLWLATEEKGLLCYSPASGKLKQYTHEEKNRNSLGSDLVRAIVFRKNKEIWIGSINGGLDLFNPETSTFQHYMNEPGDPSSLSQRTVSALYEDKQGNLWIGTHRGGINLYSPGSEKFKLFQQELNKNSLSYNDVKAFHEDANGNIWIGTDGGGLNLFNQKTNSFVHYKTNPYAAGSLGSDAVLDIMEDHNKDLFIGTWGGGLNLMNRKNGTFTKFLFDANNPSSISSDYVQKTFEDSYKNLWVGTYYGGLNLFDRSNNRFCRLIHGSNGSKLIGNNIISINEDQKGNLWIGTDDGGLNCYNLETKYFTHYFLNNEKKPDLRVIFIDHKGRLWVGQKGLYLFNPIKNTFSIYTQKAGLASDFIKGITEDERGNFWISTAKGLVKFNPEHLTFNKYNTADGLQSLEFEANACMRKRNGEMFFGGINGFNSFFPEDIKTNKYIPPVYLTEFQIFNNKIIPDVKGSPLQNDISFTKEIKLSYNQSTFSFSFAGLNYTVSENNKYAYKLDGFDKDWNYDGSARKALYTNLDPGTYTFRVKASNNDNVWNTEGTAVRIVISPPYWATWWFKILAIGLVIYIAYVLLSFKRKLELKTLEEKKREEMHQVQLQFFTNISHEFRTPLSLILGPIDRLLKEDAHTSFQNYYKTIHRNANRLLSLINELMDFRKIESGALKLKVIEGNLSLFIDEVAEEFREMAAEKNISFKVNKTGKFTSVWFDRHVIEKIMLNLVNNSLKYTKAGGEVSLDILDSLDGSPLRFENQLFIKSNYTAQQYVFIRVADNGIGISKDSIHHLFERYYRITEAHLGSGVGLAFVKSLTMLHKGFIQVSSEKHLGTEIIIALPCNKEGYTPDELWGQSNEHGGTRLESISYASDQHTLPTSRELISTPTLGISGMRHILIVDDNEELRTFLKEALSSNYHISEAEDGYNGLIKARDVYPDLIISDVMMPGMDGTEFCKRLKEDIETSHIPFLMLTARDSIEAEIEGVESGADLYFTKPININLLQITIKNIFEQRQKLKDHYSKDHSTELRELVHSTKDREFMDKLLMIINEQLINPDLDIDYLCGKIGMSRTKLYQKIKTITGQSIGEFVRSIRLRKAAEILTSEDVLITEVMYRVGIQTQSYFTKAFKKEFGKTPTQFLQDLKQQAV